MNNYTTFTYQTKRNILNFTEKISNDLHKPTIKLCKDMTYGILKNKSVSLTEIARGLKEKTRLNYTVDRISYNLMNLYEDEESKIKSNYLNEVNKYLPDKEVIVLNDNTDLNKECSKKLEDLCTIRDASSQVEKYVNGYMVCEYAALSKNEEQPISLYSKIYSTASATFKSENDETIKGEDEVNAFMKTNGKVPIYVRDRGYDANEYFIKDIKEDNKFVTRLKGNRNLIFKDKTKLVSEVVSKRKGKICTKLMYHGENKECYISYTKVKLPAVKNKEAILVTVHGLKTDDTLPMMLLTNLEVKNKDAAERVVKIYFLRWRIEEYFKAKKEFNWENSLVRTIKSMNNLNMFLTISMFYLTTVAEKLNKTFLSNIIMEQALSLKERALVKFGIVSTGIKNILAYAKTGIEEWKDIEKRPKLKQLCLSI